MATKPVKKRTNKKQATPKKNAQTKIVPTVPEQGGFLSWFQESTTDKKVTK